MAVIGRAAAVAELGKVRFHGYIAWIAWLFVHLIHLVEYQNRVSVLIQWGWNYFTRNRSARMITYPRQDIEKLKTDSPSMQSSNISGRGKAARVA